jgi:glycosyltransferase involved in cell wall biosynthesis
MNAAGAAGNAMKVLMLAPWFSVHATRPLNWLLENGCEVTFVDHGNPYPEPRDGYHFLPYPTPRGTRYYRRLGRRIAGRLGLWTVLFQLRRLSWRLKPDIVHLHWVDERACQCVQAGLRPLVLSIWGSDINYHFEPACDPARRRAIGRALAGADLILADAPDMPEKCARLAGKPVRTELLSLGINTDKFRPGYADEARGWRERLNVPEGARVLFSMRAMHQHYGHHIILETFAQARPRLDTESVLVFKTYNRKRYPESEAFEAELRRRAAELGIDRHVRWMDEVPSAQLPGLYAFADAIINYPSHDGFPVTFLEAAACERPVITHRLPSYVGTFAEKHFHLVEPGNPAELADAIAEVLNEAPARRAPRLAQARQIVRQQHDESVCINRLLQLYRSLL